MMFFFISAAWRRSLRLPAFLAALLFSCTAPAAIRYVDHKATGANTGASWADAYTEAASAILAARDRDEIWIAVGTYYPDYNPSTKSHDGNRDLRFVLKPGVAVYGGFAGGETSRAQRDWVANPVIFSGDIGRRYDFTDNTRTIMEIREGNTRSIVEGIVFILGNANSPEELGNGDVAGSGGAVWSRGDARFRFCAFAGNYAVYGGAMHAQTCVVKLTNCLFHDNHAQYVGGAFRVGVSGENTPGSEVINCTITGCTASRGGAFTSGARSIVKNNVVWHNSGATGWELVEIWLDATVSGNVVQAAMERYPEGGIIADPLIISTPSPGADGRWGTEDDDYYGGGLASNSPARDILTTADLPADVTDLNGDGDTTGPVPFDSLRRSRVLNGSVDAGALELLNTSPTAIVLTSSAVQENEPAGAVVGQLESMDANAGVFRYTLVAGPGDTDNALFQVEGAYLRTAAVLDYETRPQLSVRLRTTDSLGESFEQALPVSVINVTDQILSVKTARPDAYFPAGGLPLWKEGEWPASFGAVTVTRSGEIQEPLSMRLNIAGTAIYGNHYMLTEGFSTAAALTEGYLKVLFAAGQESVTLGVRPLFPAIADHEPRTVALYLVYGGTDYDIAEDGGTAIVTIHLSPQAAWRASHPEAPDGPAGYLEQLFPSDTVPGSGFQPRLEFADGPSGGREVLLVASPSATARDISPLFETSRDLQNWEPATPGQRVRTDGSVEYRFPMTQDRARFFRTSAEVRTRPLNRTTGGQEPLSMIGLPAGRIILGSGQEPAADTGNAQITQPFWLSRTEVTRAQYAAVMGLPAPAQAQAALPAAEITWDQAVLFAAQLTETESAAGRLPTGYVHRLPTEAEWEYASACGTEQESALPPGAILQDYAWFSENGFAVSHRAGQKLSNDWGFHDMYGNVAEWVHDRWSYSFPTGPWNDPAGPATGALRTVRGGHFGLGASAQTSWWRSGAEPETASPNIGFRIALAFPLSPP